MIQNVPHPLLTPAVLHLFEVFDNQIRLVGGCVRDYLMNRPVHDIDLATPLSPQEVLKRLKSANIEVYESGIAHGTVTAVINHIPYEITTLRQDVKTDGRHAQVDFIEKYEEDAARLDLTINALYMDKFGNIFDYTNGQKDIQEQKIRFIGNPDLRVQEDYLRILRFFRFFAFYGKGKPDFLSLQACFEHATGLKNVAVERKREEILRLLSAPNPLPALHLMQTGGILETLQIPADLKTLERFLKIMPHSDVIQRLAVLTGGAPLNHLKLSKEQINRLKLYATNPNLSTKSEARFLLWQVGKREYLFFLNKYRLSHSIKKEDLARLRRLTVPYFPINGTDLLKLGYLGKEIGQQLDVCKKIWMNLNFCRQKKLVIKNLLIYNKKKGDKNEL